MTEKSGVLATLMNLAKAFVGSGILALPHAFSVAGLLASSVVVTLVAWMTVYCMRILIITVESLERTLRENRESGADTDSDELEVSWMGIGARAFGCSGSVLAAFAFFGSQLGFCVAYVALISDTLHSEVSAISRLSWILVLCVCWAVVAQVRHLRWIAWTSGAGNLVYCVVLGAIFYDGAHQPDSLDSSHWTAIHAAGLPYLFGTAAFALEGIGLLLSIRRAAVSVDAFNVAMHSSVLLVCIVYIIFGVLGASFYGPSVDANITKNLSRGGIARAVKISLCITVFFSFVLQLFPVLEACDSVVSFLRSRSGAATPPFESTARRAAATEMGVFSVVSNGETDEQGLPTAHSDELVGGKVITALDGDGDDTPRLSSLHDAPNRELSSFEPAATLSMLRVPNHPQRTSLLLTQSLVRAALVAAVGLIAAVLSATNENSFGLIVAVVGCVANSLLSFVLPCLFYVKVVLWPQRALFGLVSFIVPVSVIVLGVLTAIVGLCSIVLN